MAESAQNRQIAVATDNVRLVLDDFARGGIVPDRTDNPRLGLTLLTFDDIATAGRALATRREAELPADLAAPQAGDPLDLVLTELRLRYRTLYAGWIPLLGKNRTLVPVQFKPYTHGFDKPSPIKPLNPLAVDADQAGKRVLVGLFDTRLAPHSQLNGRYVADASAMIRPVPAGGERQWWEGHATFIAGIIRRNAPSAVLDVRTTLRDAPAAGEDPVAEESWNLDTWALAYQLAEFQDTGISVLNLSLGLTTGDAEPPLVLSRAIAQLTPDIVVVAAAGNHGSATVSAEERENLGMPLDPRAVLFPAALDNVISVGPLNKEGQVAEFTPRGAGDAYAPWIDVYAQGEGVESTYLGDGSREMVRIRDRHGVVTDEKFEGFASGDGSSFAAGLITAKVADLLAHGRTPGEAAGEARETCQRP
jgi:hypothetical protein